jgi:hypothetical protein
MTFSALQTSGSYSTTPRSANKATFTDWIPGCVRSIPSIDYSTNASTIVQSEETIQRTSTQALQVIPSILNSHFSEPVTNGSLSRTGNSTLPLPGDLPSRFVKKADIIALKM